MDATKEKELADAHDVKGYPTLFFYNGGKKQDYSGGTENK